jgi:UDP-N-acetylglucosamine 2-epimerase (non-hydrolysing)
MTTFAVSADYDLNLMRHGQSPAGVAGTILATLPGIIDKAKPNLLIVQGDTITTFGAAFAAYLNRVPVAHIEAGLRTGDLDHPFPEEMSRILTSRLASLHFAPTDSAKNALLAEGVDEARIFVTGNTVIDALLNCVDPSHEFTATDLKALRPDDPVILVTTHRRESFGKPLENTCRAIRKLAREYTHHQFVIPVHPNPNVREHVLRILSDIPNVTLCGPLEYVDFVNLMARSTLILTDSGGIQEEAPSLNVPVLVLRETTERPDGISAGNAKLIGTKTDAIVAATRQLLENKDAYMAMSRAANPYGDGSAARQIVAIIANQLGHNVAAAS